MQFLHPEFLYFLFLLVIPVIVHLFQLRKFQKTPFTNVAFLKKLSLQTRKSSRLKKWLTLLARLLALACIILAFAQPFVPNSETATQEKDTLIYLDNSFSMSLEGTRGELLKRAVQQLMETLPSDKKFTLLTNDEVYRNTSTDQLKKELLQLEYSAASPSLNTILLRAKNEYSDHPALQKEFVAISDFQENTVDIETPTPKDLHLGFVQLQPVNNDNVFLDSLFVSGKSMEKLELTARLSYTGKKPENVPISLYNDSLLLAKTSAHFKTEKTTSVQLSINKTSESIKGKILLEDHGLAYDNSFYFSIDSSRKINVVALNHAPDDFLKRVYATEGFDFSSFQKGEFDYNKIATANTVILNELEGIPTALIPILTKLTEGGGHLVVIPPGKINTGDYRSLLTALHVPTYSKATINEKKITEIVFAHPLYKNVFEDQVTNFQYPKVQSSFGLEGNSQSILKYADGSPFLAQDGNVFLFSAGLNKENSNFQQSPLIVPTFYNIAKQSLKLPQIYYTIGNSSTFAVSARLQKDEIVSIKNESFSFIPSQQSSGEQVEITTGTLPHTSGIYDISKNNEVIQTIAYNYNRKESALNYADLEQMDDVLLSTDVADFFTQLQEKNEIDELWKWFVIFAVSFLFIEVLLLKYLK